MAYPQLRLPTRSSHRAAGWLVFFIALAPALFGTAEPAPEPILIKGSYTYKRYDAEGNVRTSITHPFEAHFAAGKYLLNTKDPRGDLEVIIYSDGEDTYCLLPRTTTDDRNVELGYVNRGAFPKFGSAAGEILWLGLAPASFLAGPSAKTPDNYSMYTKNGKELNPEKTHYMTNPDGYVTSARLWCTDKLVINGETRYQLPPYHKGFECGTFNVEGEIRVAGRYVAPERFTFVVHTTKKAAKDAFDRALFARYEFTVESGIPTPEIKDLRLVSRLGTTHMRDYRFTDKAPLIYKVTNSEWRKMDSLNMDRSKIAMMEAEAAIREKRGEGPIRQVVTTQGLPKQNRLIIGAMIGCVIIFPPILFWWARSKNQHNQKR